MFVRQHSDLFQSNRDIASRDRGKRRNNVLINPIRRLKVITRNVSCIAITIYNQLPNEIKDLHWNRFKKTLFNYLLDKCYYKLIYFLEEKKKLYT